MRDLPPRGSRSQNQTFFGDSKSEKLMGLMEPHGGNAGTVHSTGTLKKNTKKIVKIDGEICVILRSGKLPTRVAR